jgi:phage protein D
MAETQAIYKEEELLSMGFYVPAFEIYVGQKKLKGELRRDIMTVSYTDSIEAIDSFSLTVSNWDAENRAFKYLNFESNPFNVGEEIEVWMGYHGQILKKMLNGEITTMEPNFPQSGNPTLNVRGLNVLHRLRKKQETRFYKNKTDGEIAKKIAKRLGLEEGNIKDPGERHNFLAQKNRYDIVFLLERARRIGYEVTVEDKKLNFQPSTDITRKQYVLEWGKSLIDFRPTLTTAKQVAEVKVKGWSPQQKKTITATAKRKDLDTKGLGSKKKNKLVEKAFDQCIEIIVDQPISNKKEAKRLAKEKLEQIAKELIKGQGSTVGLPDLRAGSVVEIKFPKDDFFTGTYYVIGTTHTIGDSGYTTKFNVRREEKEEKQ